MLCACGCGQHTKVAPRNRPEKGLVKGLPQKFVQNHFIRTIKNKDQSARYDRHVSVGDKYGFLTVDRVSPEKTSRGSLWVFCKCSCGKEVEMSEQRLVSGYAKSCGCLIRRREYIVWQGAKSRCGNPGNAHYRDYGGRGIEMCQSWRESFWRFFYDMGYQPKGLTLDRIENDGNYEPSNCRWITISEQNRNRRSTKLSHEKVSEIRLIGSSLTQDKISKMFGVSRSSISTVLSLKTWNKNSDCGVLPADI